jgi:hypothetical protein
VPNIDAIFVCLYNRILPLIVVENPGKIADWEKIDVLSRLFEFQEGKFCRL